MKPKTDKSSSEILAEQEIQRLEENEAEITRLKKQMKPKTDKQGWELMKFWGKYITPYVFLGFNNKKTAKKFNYPEFDQLALSSDGEKKGTK